MLSTLIPESVLKPLNPPRGMQNEFFKDSKNRIKTDKSLIDKTSINHASLPSEICNNANFGKTYSFL